MIIRASGAIQPELTLLTLGRSCHYLLGNESDYCLIDPGSSVHVPHLLRRIRSMGYPLENLKAVLLTHEHPERIGGLPLIRRVLPSVVVRCSPKLAQDLSGKEYLQKLYAADLALKDILPAGRDIIELSSAEYIDLFPRPEPIMDSDVFQLVTGESLRAISCPGHTDSSFAYLVQSCNYLIVDEGAGYFNGRALIAPGGDSSLTEAALSYTRFLDHDLSGICLPQTGVATGNLVRKHLLDLKQNTADLIEETSRALTSGISWEIIESSIRAGFYTVEDGDVFEQWVMDRSLGAVMTQLHQRVVP